MTTAGSGLCSTLGVQRSPCRTATVSRHPRAWEQAGVSRTSVQEHVPWGLLGLDSSMAVSWQCWPLVVLGLVALQACTCLGTYEHTCTLSTRSRGVHPQGICGKNLPKILSDICGPRGYMGRRFNKREAPTDASVELGEETESIASRLKDILLGKKEALSYLHKRQASYGSQGITCECCYNACNFYELLEYCQFNK